MNRICIFLFWLTAFLLCATNVQAQEPYAILSDNNTVLTFFYDTQKANRNGMSIGPFEYIYSPTDAPTTSWYNQCSTITTVVFDGSFANCMSLTSTSYWFYNCEKLTTITGIENLMTDNVTNMNYMFYGCSGLTSLDVSGFKTDNVTSMRYMFYGCKSLTSLDVSGFKTDNVTYMDYMFYGCSGLTSLDVSTFRTGNVKIMWGMFRDCSSLTSLDVSGFKTDNVTGMLQMFSGCSGLTSLDVSGFKTDNVTDMNNMFSNCSSLVNLDLSGFNTDNVKDMGGMFYKCSALARLDLSNFDTKKVTEMSWMFHGCTSLQSIDMSNFNTEKVTGMHHMFNQCASLELLDLSSFNTAVVERMWNMFTDCSSLKTIYVSEMWSTANVTNGGGMFKECIKLVGGLGTTYDETNTNHTYAHIDGGERNPGYLTDINNRVTLKPIEGETTVDTEKLKDESLTNNVVDGIYYNVGANGYDATDGSIVISEVTSMSKISNSAPGSEDVKNNFCGVISKVAKGKGVFTMDVKTSGDAQLVFQIGNDAPTIVKQDERGDMMFPYDVAEDTYVYIYAIHGSGNTSRTRADQEPLVKIYSITVSPGEDMPKFKLTYSVDGKEYKTSELEYGTSITAEGAPTKEGYTFSGWSEIPKTMPAKDVTVTGTFTVNKYKLTYTVDGEEYKTSEVEYGASITAEAEPTKEGYTFSGWSEVPATMPAKDVTITGTFTINKYKLTYTVDGKEYKTIEVEYGAIITPEAAPTKEGYTFSGWSEIPKTMAAQDVTVTGTFTVNKYKLTYTVDGKEYKTSEVEYGASITAEAAPTKEGYTFSGWSDIPKTMPAKDVTVTGTFTVNKYKLIYTVDGKEYKTSEGEYGASITVEAAPTKEGYTFSGWSEVPKTMPAKDVTITGTFTVNKYKLTYTVDGKEYKTSEVEYGASITAEAAPTKEGYTFSGWSEVPKTMPAKDVTITGTFTINKYKLTYTVDGKEYKTIEVEYGASITAEAEPAKEGYTFSGWSEIPKTMPAKDVTITGTFSKGSYKLTYIVDGETYKTVGYDFESTITPEAAPTKEGYTFSGWSEIPKTMPAKDVTVTGTFTINKYKLTYTVDGLEYKTSEVEFGASITAEAVPTKEGYTFSGWSDIPKTMPAKDVTITGTFTVNKYKLIYMVDGEEYKTYEVEYGSNITAEAEPTKEGYVFSGWSDVPSTMPAEDVTVTGTFIQTAIGEIRADGDSLRIYDLNGNRLDRTKSGVNIIRQADGKVRKVVVK